MHGNGRNLAHASPPQHEQQREQRYVARHDFAGTADLRTTLVHAISNVTGADVTQAESVLADHVDPRALDRLFRPLPDGTRRADGRLSFSAWGHRVTVFSDGQITIEPTRAQAPVRG